jgi:hypothetical protein
MTNDLALFKIPFENMKTVSCIVNDSIKVE